MVVVNRSTYDCTARHFHVFKLFFCHLAFYSPADGPETDRRCGLRGGHYIHTSHFHSGRMCWPIFFTTEITFYVITERLKHRIPGTSFDSNVNATQRYDLDEMSCNKCERIAFASFQIEKKQHKDTAHTQAAAFIDCCHTIKRDSSGAKLLCSFWKAVGHFVMPSFPHLSNLYQQKLLRAIMDKNKI